MHKLKLTGVRLPYCVLVAVAWSLSADNCGCVCCIDLCVLHGTLDHLLHWNIEIRTVRHACVGIRKQNRAYMYRFDVTEAQMVIICTCLLTALVGPEMWLWHLQVSALPRCYQLLQFHARNCAQVLGVPLNLVYIATVSFISLFQVASYAQTILNGGVGKNGSTVAVRSSAKFFKNIASRTERTFAGHLCSIPSIALGALCYCPFGNVCKECDGRI